MVIMIVEMIIFFLCKPKNLSIKLEKDIFYSWKSPLNVVKMIKEGKFKTPGVIAALLHFLLENNNLRLIDR